MEAKSLASNKYGYSHSHQSNDYSSQARDGYYSDRLTKANHDTAKPGNTNGIMRWPEKEPFTTSSERRPTVSQNEMGHVATKIDQHKNLPQFATTPGVNKTKLSTQFLGPEVVKGNKVAGNDHESGFGNPNELNYQKQQLKNIYQTNPFRYLRDPRLKDHGKSDSIYQGQTLSVAEFVGTEGYRKPSEQKITRRYWEEIRPSHQNTMPPTCLNTSLESQCRKSPAHAQSNYQKRSAATYSVSKYRNNSKSSEELKLQTWERHMQSSPARLIKHGINETFFREKDSSSCIPQTTPPISKTCRTSQSDDTISIRLQQPFIGTKKGNLASHCTPDQLDFELSNTNSLKKNNELNIHNAKYSEICAREERIRNLKILLEKQERALETLRFQRRTPFINETDDDCFTCNEDRIKQSMDAIMGECHLTDDVAILGINSGSLKRRWLKNWKFNEKDDVEHKSPVIKKRKEIYTDSTETEGENQNLSNAEYTALEGLVRLGKD